MTEATPPEPRAPDGKQAERGGLRTFLIVWAGQFVSSLGSAATGFALAIWVYQQTGSATLLSLVVTVAALPVLLVGPLAGALVDRWDRRVIMLLSDSVAALATLVTAVLVLTGNLHIWHIYVLVTVGSTANAAHGPASAASVRLLVPKRLLGRASGMQQLGQGLATAAAPVIAGGLILLVGIGGVLVVDLLTFVVAVITLSIVRIPRPPRSEESLLAEGSLLRETTFGLRYIWQRKGLAGLMLVFLWSRIVMAFANVLYIPLLLSFTSPAVLGATLSTGAIGMVLGGLLVTTRGVPSRRVLGQLVLTFASGVLMIIMGFRPSAILIAVTLVAMMFIFPIVRGTDQVLWQTKVAADVQGRIFALRRTAAQGSAPLAYLLAGFLADRVFEPLLVEGGALVDSVGRLIGVGPGRGIGLMFCLMGLGTLFAAIAAWLQPRIRNLEAELPDAALEPSDPIPRTATQPV